MTWSWFTDDYWSRFADDGALLIIMTRWHVDDLLGRFVKRFPDAKLLRYPAIAEHDEQYRRAGEALFPELKPLDFLQERRTTMTEASWQSIYQQHPIIVGGGIFPIDKLRVLPVFDRSKIRTSVRAWDKAATHGAGDFTAGVLMHAMNDGIYVIEDVVRGQWSASDREQLIKATAAADEHRNKSWYEIVIEQEPGSAGRESFEATARNLAGYIVHADKVSGSKQIRAEPFAAQTQAANVFLVAGSWVEEYKSELEAFPNGRHDDQVDASAMAFARLTKGLEYNTNYEEWV
jgi:predicted phage terminase large subunit-like protein